MKLQIRVKLGINFTRKDMISMIIFVQIKTSEFEKFFLSILTNKMVVIMKRILCGNYQ